MSSLEESFTYYSKERDLFEDKNSLRELRKEVGHLRKQVKYLKKMVVLSVFETKEDMKEFLTDVW